MKELETKVNEVWNEELVSWNNPKIPDLMAPKTQEEIMKLGEVGMNLAGELAFMKYPEFQTYANLNNIKREFGEDEEKGLRAVLSHEIGHRFCPFSTIDLIILDYAIKNELERKGIDKKRADKLSPLMLNLASDMVINTARVENGDSNIPWAYERLSKTRSNRISWRVYGRSMEHRWDKQILPKDVKLTEEEENAARQLAGIFTGFLFDRKRWRDMFTRYAEIYAPFIEQDENTNGKGGKDRKAEEQESAGEDSKEGNGMTIDDITGNIPSKIDDKTAKELARRLAETGQDGMPRNPKGLKEYKDIMAGFERGDEVRASIEFYETLSSFFDVPFAERPFGRARTSPFQPRKWQPSDSVNELDVEYSLTAGGGIIIPGVNTYMWNQRRRERRGLEEIIPDIELYLDSSGSMPNPKEEISLPVLAGFVVARKAHRKGAKIKVTNFSGEGQHETVDWGRDLNKVFGNLAKYFNGGTIFPVDELCRSNNPRQVVVITDTFLYNEDKTIEAIKKFRSQNPRNGITIYALHEVANAEKLRNAGAEVIYGTTTNIFKRVIGKTEEVYSR